MTELLRKYLWAIPLVLLGGGAAAVVVGLWMMDIKESSWAGESDRYKPVVPAPAAAQAGQSPVCESGYPMRWAGCSIANQ